MTDTIEGPAYVIGDAGVSYVDDWCYGASRFLGSAVEYADARRIIAEDIRRRGGDTNGARVYWVSDHGNVGRCRPVVLRRIRAVTP